MTPERFHDLLRRWHVAAHRPPLPHRDDLIATDDRQFHVMLAGLDEGGYRWVISWDGAHLSEVRGDRWELVHEARRVAA